jgi:DNA repair exonuclease SbcCD nuclease subunit
MSTFKFLHAADLHLDSPLLGLSAKSRTFAQRIEDASRVALDNLVDLAISEGCPFVVLSGDVFDGDLRNMPAGLFFVSRLRRLQDAGIRVLIALGNHDAENRFVSKLAFSDNVHVFSTRAAESVPLDDLGVVLHGRSFPKRDVTDNLASDYPAPTEGLLNIGVLHTACIGREGPHASYAPCSVEQLVNHGYGYWALGHVHAHAVLHEAPFVVYPGNLQGRHAKEIGPKGAVLVTVTDGEVEGVEHRALDAVRWAHQEIDVSTAEDLPQVLLQVRDSLETAVGDAEGRPMAVRITLTGVSPLDPELRLRREDLHADVATLCAGFGHEVWIERLALRTRAPRRAAGLDPSLAGQIAAEVASVSTEALATRLEKRLAEVATKMPGGARLQELFERLRAEAPERALDLAAALLAGEEDHLAAG